MADSVTPFPRTKIVATIGPASSSAEIIRRLLQAGMSVARLNFSHGTHDEHAERVRRLRAAAAELELPLALLQDLQGPKIRVSGLPPEGVLLADGDRVQLVPQSAFAGQPCTIGLDYPRLAAEAEPGTRVLLDDGLLELRVEGSEADRVLCRVVRGGMLTGRKSVNVPGLDLRLPSLTEKDRRDLAFGVGLGVDFVSLSFVRTAADVRNLKGALAALGADTPVVAKIEKPQAVATIEDIMGECDAVMVARGDLGVELDAEKVPLIQKRIIRLCNRRKMPVITATQMLESMLRSPRPTRAEASDVANAIIDGTDAVMLSGESAVGEFPVEAVEMLARIARDVEPEVRFANFAPDRADDTEAISEALTAIDGALDLRLIVACTESGRTARVVAEERPRVPVVALTPRSEVCRRLALVWGVRPVLLTRPVRSSDELLREVEAHLVERRLALPGDKILIVGGLPLGRSGGTNFLKIHTIAGPG